MKGAGTKRLGVPGVELGAMKPGSIGGITGIIGGCIMYGYGEAIGAFGINTSTRDHAERLLGEFGHRERRASDWWPREEYGESVQLTIELEYRLPWDRLSKLRSDSSLRVDNVV